MDNRSKVVEDLITRFRIVPESASDLLKLRTHLEQAYYQYDLQRHDSPSLPLYSFKTFIEMLCRHSPSLAQACSGVDLDQLIERWKGERQQLIGAIIINPMMTKCILVQNLTGNWEFPVSSLDVGKGEVEATVNHVYEQTGLDISDFIRDGQFLEGVISGSRVKLFIAVFGSEVAPLQKSVKWFSIKHLPHHHGNVSCQQTIGVDSKNLFSVMLFIEPLWEWITHHQSKATSPPDLRMAGSRPNVTKDTPDPRIKGPKQAPTQNPSTTPLRSSSSRTVKAPPSQSLIQLGPPNIAHPTTFAQENLRRQDVPQVLTSSPQLRTLLPTPLLHTPISSFPGAGGAIFQGLTRAPVVHRGTPLPGYRGPIYGYGPTYDHTPYSFPLPTGRVEAGPAQAAAHAHHSPLQLECSRAFINFKFKGSILT